MMSAGNLLKRLIHSDAWCPEPWVDLSSDTGAHYKLCCVSAPLPYTIHEVAPLAHWNSANMRAARRAMLDGDRASLRTLCESCQAREDGATASRRQGRIKEVMANPRLSAIVDNAVAASVAAGDGSAPATYFERVDLRVNGNLCNLRCVTCSPQSSSAIGEEQQRLGVLQPGLPTLVLPLADTTAANREQFWRDLRAVLPRSESIYFAGGEPFMSEAHYAVLDLALELKLADVLRLSYSTNLTVLGIAGRSITRYLNQFARVSVCVSLDNLYAKNDYIRFGSRFAHVVQNVKALAASCPHVDLQPSTCVSIYNVLDLPAIHEFCTDLTGTHSFVNILTTPRRLRATHLPPPLRTLALERLSAAGDPFDAPRRWVEHADPNEQTGGFADFVAYCEYLDRARGTRFLDIYPEFAPYFRPETGAVGGSCRS
jgi:organic radical activating enzyme